MHEVNSKKMFSSFYSSVIIGGTRKEASMVRVFSSLGSRIAIALILLAASSASALAQTAKARVAIMNFENNSTWSWWGDNLGAAAADELTTQLVKTGKFTVIERAQLNTILAEQSLGASGAVTPATAAKVGKLLGVQLIMTGSITQFSIQRTSVGISQFGVGGSYSNAESKMDVRLISTETGEILAVAEGQGNKRMGGGFFRGVGGERTFDQGAAQEALRPAVENVVKAVAAQSDKFAAIQPAAPEGQVVGAKDGSFYINRGQNSGVKVGQRFDVHRVTDEIKDADGRVLDRVIKKVGVLEVTQVLSQSAICKIVEGTATVNDAIR
jgi:curli biogenesis system outer membrane secretion channel CsgG